MNTFIATIILLLNLTFSGPASSQEKRNPPAFKHPGIAHGEKDFTFIKAQIKAEKEPWTSSWSRLQNSNFASLNWKPKPFKHVERGPYNNPDIGSSEFRDDSMAAYIHALCWVISEKPEHLNKSIEIIDAWSSTLETVKNHDTRLLIGMEAPHFCIAAEIVKHTSDVWPAEKQITFASMLQDLFYPLIKDFYPSANGNWDASMMQAIISMAVFLDDHEMFQRATDYYLKGEGNGAIGNYFKPSGQCQESGRDQGHTQMGIRFLANTSETAWIQNVDLYGALENRLLTGFEYTAKYNLGHDDVPYEPFKSFEGRYHYKKISDEARGRFQAMYERVFNHYHHRKGLEAPFTKAALMKNRERAARSRSSRRGRNRVQYHIDTLMYAKQ